MEHESDKKHLLAVDDEASVLEYLKEILDPTHYRCTVATGFQEAVEIASFPSAHFDILLTDIILPPFHGRDLANRIVHMHPQIKVLFMSGYPLKMLKTYGLMPPRSEYLSKPFTPGQLYQSLDSITEAGETWSTVNAVDFQQ